MSEAASQVDYEAVYAYIGEQIEASFADPSIIQSLVGQGWDQPTATQLVANMRKKLSADAERAQERNFARKQQRKLGAAMTNIFIGGGICLVGVAITGMSFYLASESPRPGAKVFIASGAILIGGLQFLLGLAELASVKTKKRKKSESPTTTATSR